MTEIWQTILTGFLILLGLVGSFLPILPGPPIAWGGLLFYGFVTDFEKVSILAIVIFGALTLLTIAVDLLAPVLGAKGYKASRAGVVGAFLGGFLGIVVAGPLGIVLGPLVGAFAGEYYAHKDEQKALRVAWGSFVGFLVGSLVKVAVVLAMAVYFGFHF